MKAFVGCAGFGGVDIALRERGFEVIGVEIDMAIAMVNVLNGGNIIVADLLDFDFGGLVDIILGHFSPPCPRFSIARNKKAVLELVALISDMARFQVVLNGESEIDMALARKICEFIRVVRPAHFTLENVWQYRNSLSWLNIWYTLLDEGYGVDAWNLNAADYGIPQSRKRMIVIARRDGRQPAKPFPTHAKEPDLFSQRWVGWYSSIEDLLSGLPESEFAPWQLARLPDELKTLLLMTSNTNLLESDYQPGRGVIGVDDPANTVMASVGRSLPRALLVPGDNTGNGVVLVGIDPMVTVQTRPPERCPHRAFIVDCQYNGSADENGNRGLTIRETDQPVFTVTATQTKRQVRVAVQGRVVSMTPRCLARFQGIPNWFVLPENRDLACRGIGNLLPPGLYGAVLGSLGLEGKRCILKSG